MQGRPCFGRSGAEVDDGALGGRFRTWGRPRLDRSGTDTDGVGGRARSATVPTVLMYPGFLNDDCFLRHVLEHSA